MGNQMGTDAHAQARAHASGESHHHHTHARGSVHRQGCHLLQVEHLSVSFRMYETRGEGLRDFLTAPQSTVFAVRDLSVAVHEGEIVAVVGASGAGKTLLADALLGLSEPNARVEGHIWFKGQRCTACDLVALRGHGISLVPQSVASLDPLMRVGEQVRGVAASRADARARAQRQRQLFARYGLDEATARRYPHELSGGMARRVLLCCALMDDPSLIVADEPTPGLDTDLAMRALADFRQFADQGGGVLLITHDIELALNVADRVAVFDGGTVVEETSVESFRCEERLRSETARRLWRALPQNGFKVGTDA